MKKPAVALMLAVLGLAGTIPVAHAQPTSGRTTATTVQDLALFHATTDSAMYPNPSYLSPTYSVPKGTNVYCTQEVTSATWRYCYDVSLKNEMGYMNTSEIAPGWV